MRERLEKEQDIEFLRKLAIAQHHQLEAFARILAEKSARIDQLIKSPGDLQASLELLAKRTAEETPTLPRDKNEETGSPSSESSDKPQTGHGPREQEELIKETRTYELDEPDKVCPACGGDLTAMAGQFETSEMIDVVAVEYRQVEVLRQKYNCSCGGCIETAPGPERAREGGRYSLDFALDVAVNKYLDHTPLHRQVRAMMRAGLEVTPTTLWDQLWGLSNLLRPAYDALQARLLCEPVLGLDQTSWPNLDAKRKKAWQMWGFTGPGMATYAIRSDKSADTMEKLLGPQPRVLVCDMLSTHLKYERDHPNTTLAACWAHVFRRFRDAAENHPNAEQVLAGIGQLYEIDRKASDLEERARLRKEQSRPVLQELFRDLRSLIAPKTTDLGQAIRYTLRHEVQLSRFLDDPRIKLDNNGTELALRGPVVGRKNHYGSKSRAGTQAAAIFYSLFETAKLQGVNPQAYLREAAIAARRGEVLLAGALVPP